jgi:5-bromo-4-chloroindolyl phosphate hydrolysis protein
MRNITSIFGFELELPFELLGIPLIITEILPVIRLWVMIVVGMVIGMVRVSLEVFECTEKMCERRVFWFLGVRTVQRVRVIRRQMVGRRIRRVLLMRRNGLSSFFRI